MSKRASLGLSAALVCCVAALGLQAAAPSPKRSDKGDVQRGFQLSLKVCEDCHVVADGRSRRNPPAPDAPSFFDLAKQQRVTPFYLRAFFRTPHRNMPDLILPPGERDDIIAYIMSLRPEK